MPYEVAGNAAGLDPEALMSDMSSPHSGGGIQVGGGGRRGRGGQGGAYYAVKGCLACWFITGVVLTILGISRLPASTPNTRGAELKQWKEAMDAWTGGGEAAFRALHPVARSNAVDMEPPNPVPPGPPPPTGWPLVPTPFEKSLNEVANAYGPQKFGEATWSDSDSVTTSSVRDFCRHVLSHFSSRFVTLCGLIFRSNVGQLTDFFWEGTAECPGSRPNQTCTLNITTSSKCKSSPQLDFGGMCLRDCLRVQAVARSSAR